MSKEMRYTLLGCSSSPGVPRINGDWGACDPDEPKNRRLRCSLLVERIGSEGVTRIVVDTSPDFRQQMINARVPTIDCVLFTHSHADHVHGIDDLRGFALAQRQRIPVFADHATTERLFEGFRYCFEQPKGSMYPPILEANKLYAGRAMLVSGAGGNIHVLPVLQVHGPIHSLGFRFSLTDDFSKGGLCYSPDVSDIPEASLGHLQELDCWIVDALQYKPHISHFSLSESLDWISRIKPKRAVLTHMHIPLDYKTVKDQVPDGVEPGYDGMVIEV